jgi:hypothetical protein
MCRDRVLTFVVLAALTFCPLSASTVQAQSNSDARAVRIKGDVTALELDLHQATLAQVMTALGRFNIRYRSPVTLNDPMNGTYAGSLGRVLSLVLDDYNYAIRRNDAELIVIVIGRRGQQASPAPLIIPIRRRPSD